MPWPLVGSADSLGGIIMPWVNRKNYVKSEPSRAPFTRGYYNIASSAEMIQWQIGNSMPGGYVLVVDCGRADKNGVITSDAVYRNFVNKVIALVPNNRTIIWVYPGYDKVKSPVGSAEAFRRVYIAKERFDANPGQPVRFINWWYAVHSHPINKPGAFTYDGLHPSRAGAIWLANQIHAIVPYYYRLR